MYCKGAGSLEGGADDHGVIHRAMSPQGFDDAGHRRRTLPAGDIDADDVLPLLIDDRVDANGGLARLAVADDQLALAAADRRHGVDGFDAGLEWLLDRLPAGDARRDGFERPRLRREDRALPVERVPQRIDDPAHDRLPDRHRQKLPRALNLVPSAIFR